MTSATAVVATGLTADRWRVTLRLEMKHAVTRPAQLTLRARDPKLDRAIRALARREGISLNRAALRLLEKGAGLSRADDDGDRIGSSLDHLIGTWSAAEADAFLESIKSCEQVDEELWD